MARNRNRERWDWIVKHMTRLIELEAPDCIKADAIVKLLIPRLVALLNITEEYTKALARKMCHDLDVYSGKCTCCHKADALIDQNEEVCVKCLAIIDQFTSDIGDGNFPDDEHEENEQ